MMAPGFRKLLLLFCGVLLGASCASLPVKAPEGKPSGPRIVFEKPVYDFGFAGPEQEVAHTFRFTNTGSANLLIDRVTADCGVTTTWISGVAIPPGGKGEIRAVLETPRHEGRQEKHLTVYSNAHQTPERVLAIRGGVRRHVEVVPQGISFGAVVRGETPERSARLLQLSQERLVLRKVDADERYFTVTTSRFSEENSRGYRIGVVLKPDAPAGLFSQVITLHTNVRARPRIDLPVWADVRE